MTAQFLKQSTSWSNTEKENVNSLVKIKKEADICKCLIPMQTSFIWPVTNEAKLQKLIDNQNTELIKVFVGPFCIHGQHGLVKTELIEKLKF